MLADEVEREQWMAGGVKHPHEDHEIELLAQRADGIDIQLRKLDVVIKAEDFRRQPRLSQVALVAVDAEDSGCAAALHLDRIKTGVAADIKHAFAGQVLRQVT